MFCAERERPFGGRAAALRDYQVAGGSVRLVYVFLRGRTKNRFLPVSSKNKAPTLSDAASEAEVR